MRTFAHISGNVDCPHSPVAVLAAFEPDLAKSQHDEQTHVPCDHPQPGSRAPHFRSTLQSSETHVSP